MPKFNGFQNDYLGLSQTDVEAQQALMGFNELSPEKKPNLLRKLASVLSEPMFLLLFGTALIYFLLGEPQDGMIMLVFVVVMASITLFQEWRTDQTLQTLKDLSAPRCRVIRDGKLEMIESRLLVVGDLMLLEEGDRVSADGLILEMFDLGADESTLTGESEIVWKTLKPTPDEQLAHWRIDHCYAGTSITQGSAIVQVTAIGGKTQYGRIGIDIMNAPQHPTPLERQIRQIITLAGGIGALFFIMVLALTYSHTGNLIDSLLSGITLAMAMIPEEFPVILTVFLAMGAWRLAYQNALIRRMPSVETLGSVSVLCVDKTGTLTMNQMSLQDVCPANKFSEDELMRIAVLACEKEPYDPMEKAILAYGATCGIDAEKLFSSKFLKEYSFSSETKRMGHVWMMDTPLLAAKGAPESLLPLCHLSAEDLKQTLDLQETLAKNGQRVIAVATAAFSHSDVLPKELPDIPMRFVGLLGLSDPPRPEIPHAAEVCRNAGVRVVMITGDNGTTARAIAERIGLMTHGGVVTGADLDRASDDELIELSKTADIFVRVIPSQKMRIVRALKASGAIVAMTGDGVNDATALKYADIGIAMGKRGTSVAREAADMILMDDNFTTIVDTIRDGRRIYNNIKKAVGYVFVIHIPIALMALAAPFFHLPLLLLPIHIVLLELIIDPTCSIIFERQPAEEGLMNLPPRDPKAPLLSFELLGKAFAQGIAIFVATFGAYAWLISEGASVNLARTFTLIVFGFANLLLVYVNQSDLCSALNSMLTSRDRVFFGVNSGIVLSLLLVTYTPYGNLLAKTQPLPIGHFLCAILLAAACTLWWDLIKIIAPAMRNSRP